MGTNLCVCVCRCVCVGVFVLYCNVLYIHLVAPHSAHQSKVLPVPEPQGKELAPLKLMRKNVSQLGVGSKCRANKAGSEAKTFKNFVRHRGIFCINRRCSGVAKRCFSWHWIQCASCKWSLMIVLYLCFLTA